MTNRTITPKRDAIALLNQRINDVEVTAGGLLGVDQFGGAFMFAAGRYLERARDLLQADTLDLDDDPEGLILWPDEDSNPEAAE